MKMMRKLAVLLLVPAAAWSAPVMPYGTYLVKGAFKGEYNTVLRDFGTAAIRAQRADGTVIAEATVANADPEGYNFILSIPVASAATPKACEVGETLDCVLAADGGTLKEENLVTVGPPISVGVLTFNCTETKSYTNAADGAVAEIPTAYLAEAQAFLDEVAPGETYDPWGDYDGDGVSNYAEFLAGTIPFDESDYLHISGFGAAEAEGQLALTFEHVGGHVYAISSTDSLSEPSWGTRRVRKSAEGAELDQVLADGGDGEPGETVVYITPVGGSGFFAVEAK